MNYRKLAIHDTLNICSTTTPNTQLFFWKFQKVNVKKNKEGEVFMNIGNDPFHEYPAHLLNFIGNCQKNMKKKEINKWARY
jgi:hypothetical protein